MSTMMAIPTANVIQSQRGTGSLSAGVASAVFAAVAAALGEAFGDSTEGSLAADSSCSTPGAPIRPDDASLSGSGAAMRPPASIRSEEHTSELQSHGNLVCRLLLEKKNTRLSNVVTKKTNKHKTPSFSLITI